jgi:hypothetical protein
MRVGALLVAVMALPGCVESAPPDRSEATASPSSVGPLTQEERALYREALRRVAEHDPTTVVHHTTLTSIKSFQDDAAEIVLSRCVDGSAVDEGAVTPSPPAVVQTVVVERFENRTWRIGPVTTTSERCAR